MKVKIKGLVFVGFAAAILSANAMADDTNTVTSKSYVDAKYVGKANDYIDVSLNTTTQKNDVSIKAAKLADTVAKVHAGDSNLTTAAGVKAYTNGGTDGTLATFNEDGALTSTPIVKSAESTVNWADDEFPGSDDKVPSEAAVVGALNAMQQEIDQQSTNAFQPKTGTDDNFQIGMANGAWKTLVDGTNTTIGTDATTGNVKVNVTEMTGADGTNAGTAGTVPAPTATDNTKFLRGDKSWVQAVQTVKANGAAVTIGTDNAVNFARGSTDGTIAVNGQDVAVLNAEVTTNKAEAIVTDSTSQNYNAESTTKYATTKAVYDYVQAQTGGTVIPVMNTNVCNATTPCALVAEASGAVHWRTMATATDAGGACGDQGGCQ